MSISRFYRGRELSNRETWLCPRCNSDRCIYHSIVENIDRGRFVRLLCQECNNIYCILFYRGRWYESKEFE